MGISRRFWSALLVYCTLNCLNGQENQYKCQYFSQSGEVFCNGQTEDFNLTAELEYISRSLNEDQKVLTALEIHNSSISELRENAFSDLAFQSVRIFYAQSLARIHTKAFSSKMIDNFNVELMIANPTSLENSPPDYDLFKALNSLTNIEEMEIPLKELEFHEIPDNAFSATQNNLHYLVFVASPLSQTSGYGISRIGTKSFSGLSKLQMLTMRDIDIKNISTNAFSIDQSSNDTLTINLERCLLNDDAIAPDAFIGANRPVIVNLISNEIDYIREEKFKNFLNENPNNILRLDDNGMDCEDIDSFMWLLNNKDIYEQQVQGAVCYNGTPIWDLGQPGYQYKCQYQSQANQVYCDAQNGDFDLALELEEISSGLTSNQKVIGLLEIHNSSITELAENAFLDLAFQSVKIYDAQSLSRIHTNAFSSQMKDNLTLEFLIASPSKLENLPPNYDLFKALNSLKNVREIEIPFREGRLHDIPDNAFYETQSQLEYVNFEAEPISQTTGYGFSRIGSNIFNGLSYLLAVFFTNIEIQNISANAFAIREPSEHILFLHIDNCMLNDGIIEPDSFVGANRPVTLSLKSNAIDYIREEKFRKFLDENPNNLIHFDDNGMDCEDIQPFMWLLNNRDKYRDQVQGAYCYNGTLIWDLNDDGISSTIPETTTPVTKIPETTTPVTTIPETTTLGYAYEFKANFILTLIFILFPIFNY